MEYFEHNTDRGKDKANVLGIPVSRSGVGNIKALFSNREPGKSLILTFVNPLACALDKRNADYTVLLEQFDIVGCDGLGMVRAAKASGLSEVERESPDFTSLMWPVFQWAADNAQTVGFVGGKPGVADKAVSVINQEIPELNIVACFNGYEEEPAKAREYFIGNRTDLVICGMGAPLQERFLIQLVSGGWQGIGMTCGGFLDQTIGVAIYYPQWVDRMNLRFLYRLVKEPRRLWRRYLGGLPDFSVSQRSVTITQAYRKAGASIKTQSE